MTKNDLNLLTESLRSGATHPVKCNTTWNGFEAAMSYQAEFVNGTVSAKDKHGVSTNIVPVIPFFDLGKPLPSTEETAKANRNDLANLLTELSDHLLTERENYLPGQLVEFIPGMDNFKGVKLFRVIEQKEEFIAKPNGNPYDGPDIELLDLRVAFIHEGHDDKKYLLEAFLDSRRVRLAEGF